MLQVCVVTGANAGVGLATVQALADRGAHVIMACRSLDRGGAAAEVGHLPCDQTSSASLWLRSGQPPKSHDPCASKCTAPCHSGGTCSFPSSHGHPAREQHAAMLPGDMRTDRTATERLRLSAAKAQNSWRLRIASDELVQFMLTCVWCVMQEVRAASRPLPGCMPGHVEVAQLDLNSLASVRRSVALREMGGFCNCFVQGATK